MDGERGTLRRRGDRGGFRPTATSILKLFARADRWRPSSNPNRLNYDGYAVVAQWSQTYDFVQLATSRR